MARAYDRNPHYPVVGGSVAVGWQEPVAQLPPGTALLAIDGPAALDWEHVARSVASAADQAGTVVRVLDVREHWADWEAVRSRTQDASALPDDPYYMALADNGMADLFDSVPCPQRPDSGLLVAYGPGAALLEPDVLWYADLPKRYAESAVSAGRLPVGVNLGRPDVPGDLRRLFSVDWPMADRHRDGIASRIDRWLDLQDPVVPASIDGETLRTTLAALAHSPVRTRPYFNSTPWGGHWGEVELGFTPARGSTALGYELIAPEAGVLVGDGPDAWVELPFQLLCVLHPQAMLGAEVHERFGTSFPIRFDYLDTVGGGNLSVHLHPREEYMRSVFGWPYTQHETYYLTHGGEDARVYLGLQDGADLELMRKEVVAAIEDGTPMQVETYVQHHRATTGQLYMIPAGTPHASGRGNVVLEISATPYLYSLRFYDWLRRDGAGDPRPLAYEHAFANLDTTRQGDDVTDDLIQRPRPLRTGDGWREEVIGSLPEVFYVVHRFVIHGDGRPAEDDTDGRFHILNVSAGDGVVIEAADGHTHHLAFAETITLPAAVGAYRLRPVGEETVHVVKSLVRPS